MKISSAPQFSQPQILVKGPMGRQPDDYQGHSGKDFYDAHQGSSLSVQMGAGALIGAGIARLAGLSCGAALAAAAGGAFAGFVAVPQKNALSMAGGAVVGAAIAAVAGATGGGVVAVAGLGTVVGIFM